MEKIVKFNPSAGTSLVINDNISIGIKKVEKYFNINKRIKVFFSAPKSVVIDREKIHLRKSDNGGRNAQ